MTINHQSIEPTSEFLIIGDRPRLFRAGISSPYEPPLQPGPVVDTGGQSLGDCVALVLTA